MTPSTSQGTPRFPIPEGLKLLILGEERKEGDWVVHKGSPEMVYDQKVEGSAGLAVTYSCGYWYFRPIAPSPSEGTILDPADYTGETALSLLEFHEGSAKPLRENAQPTVVINGEDFAHILAGVREKYALVSTLSTERDTLKGVVAQAREAHAQQLEDAYREGFADGDSGKMPNAAWNRSAAKANALASLESSTLVQALPEGGSK